MSRNPIDCLLSTIQLCDQRMNGMKIEGILLVLNPNLATAQFNTSANNYGTVQLILCHSINTLWFKKKKPSLA